MSVMIFFPKLLIVVIYNQLDVNTYQQHISTTYHQKIISTRNTKNTRCMYIFFLLLWTSIQGFFSNNWIEYNSTRAPALYATLNLHSQHQLRWGNNPQHISIYTINKSINHETTCAKQPVINLYHKQVHPTMYQVYTNNVSNTHQYVPTSSTIHLMYVPTHQLLVSTMTSFGLVNNPNLK